MSQQCATRAARMTKREYVQRYTKAARRIADTESRLLPGGQRGKYVRACEEADRRQAESNADKLSKLKDSKSKMKKSLRLIEKQGLPHGMADDDDDDSSMPPRPPHPDMRKLINQAGNANLAGSTS